VLGARLPRPRARCIITAWCFITRVDHAAGNSRRDTLTEEASITSTLACAGSIPLGALGIITAATIFGGALVDLSALLSSALESVQASARVLTRTSVNTDGV